MKSSLMGWEIFAILYTKHLSRLIQQKSRSLPPFFIFSILLRFNPVPGSRLISLAPEPSRYIHSFQRKNVEKFKEMQADVKRDRISALIALDRPKCRLAGGREKFQFYSSLKNRRPHSAGMKNHPENPGRSAIRSTAVTRTSVLSPCLGNPDRRGPCFYNIRK